MNQSPLERAIAVYGQMTSRTPTVEELTKTSQHLKRLEADGEKDEERLTVYALTFLRANDDVEWLRS
jgi:hypothetical protein